MPKQLLERGDRHGCLCHTSSEGMAELMAGDLNARFLAIFFQDELNTIDGETLAMLRNESRPIICDRAAGEPFCECGYCWRWEIDNALLASFAIHF